MNKLYYVVIGSEGEYSDRYEWVACIFDNKSEAIRWAEVRNAKAKADAVTHGGWMKCNWAARDQFAKENNQNSWQAPQEYVVEKCGIEPPKPEAWDFTVIEAPLNVWGKWEEVKSK